MRPEQNETAKGTTASAPAPRQGEPEPGETGSQPAEADGSGLSLELLVHGVGGTTPQEMLGDPRTTRITGDRTAAVHRRTADADAETRPEEYRDRPVPEAYCWSNLTSGNGARALWLILLPFMVVNLAHWMRPGVPPDSAPGSAASPRGGTVVRLHGALVRLLALTLTVLLVAGACEVALDLVAWQCAGSAECVAERSWLGFTGGGSGGWWSQPGRRLALAALVPAAVTVLLWWLSHRTWSAYESQPPLPTGEFGEGEPGDRPALRLPGFWYGRRHVARLRAAHTAAGFLTIAAAVTAATTRFDRRPGGSALLDVVGWALLVLVVAGACCVVFVVCWRGRKERYADDREELVDRLTVDVLPGATVAVAVLAAVHAAWSRPDWVSADGLPGDETFGVLAVVQGLLVIALGVCGHMLYRRRAERRTALRGLAPASVAMLACAVGGLMTGGVAQRVADWLDGSGTPGADDGLILGPPTVLTWQASIIPVLLAAVLAMVCWCALRLRRRTVGLEGTVTEAYSPPPVPDRSRSRRIARTIAGAELTDAAPRFVGIFAAATLTLGAVAVGGTLFTGEVPSKAARGAPAAVEGFADTVQTLGSWLIGLGVLALLFWGRRAYFDPSARRTVGILWDVGTFWPRSAHPFAPPCYAERAVPDLAWRMATWTEQHPGGRLVISGHSQGSVLAAAAVWQLDEVTRRQVALLTYGSPLERLYGRWFPAYFGAGPLGVLHSQLDCWRNLWRRTDPIGGPVRLGASPGGPLRGDVDCGPLRDPLAYGRTVQQPLPAPILGHSDYQADPVFAEQRDLLLARLRPPAAHAGDGGDGGDVDGGSGVPRQG
ncbi:hypothetical protein [Streptomyces xiaopingdaonensis]|uniref:hypothetical protein n=1 Tax=Streptomyces xiaopingdaonensis TaxID=1565415 RepID=UPI00031D725A|nr:hypothetical protein [Streptomyces xiaopingdaonensis]